MVGDEFYIGQPFQGLNSICTSLLLSPSSLSFYSGFKYSGKKLLQLNVLGESVGCRSLFVFFLTMYALPTWLWTFLSGLAFMKLNMLLRRFENPYTLSAFTNISWPVNLKKREQRLKFSSEFWDIHVSLGGFRELCWSSRAFSPLPTVSHICLLYNFHSLHRELIGNGNCFSNCFNLHWLT